jgi:hypothetical protein
VLINFLRANRDIFAWKPADMPGVPRELIEHCLNVDPKATLNKHCPKDPFGLPRIDQVIDSTAGCDLLCFLDCYSGYH